jgi:hypothetical protein
MATRRRRRQTERTESRRRPSAPVRPYRPGLLLLFQQKRHASATGTKKGHAGVFAGYALNPNDQSGKLHIIAWANNGSPATDSTPNKPSSTGLRDFNPFTGYATRFFAPLKK